MIWNRLGGDDELRSVDYGGLAGIKVSAAVI